MISTQLYEGKKFTSWTLDRLAEVIFEEWKDLDPKLEKGIIAYEKKVTQISFKGEVNVALKIMSRRSSEKDLVQLYFVTSLSPIPNDLSTHALNTLDMGMIINLFPELEGKDCFSIGKTEPWEGSLFSQATKTMYSVVRTMLKFDSCFHLLLDNDYIIDDTKISSKKLSLTHHLNQVKAYRLAETYGHPEKFDEAIDAIKKFALTDVSSSPFLQHLVFSTCQRSWRETSGVSRWTHS